MRSNKSIEIWVGIFMLAGIAALAMLAVQVTDAGIGSRDTYRIEARFENVGGLAQNAPIMIGGVRVGRVAGIRIDPEEYIPVVSMDIDSQYDELPDDTGASILTSGLLGAQFVGLSPGASEFYLEEGDEMEFTQSAVQLETLIGQFLYGNDNE